MMGRRGLTDMAVDVDGEIAKTLTAATEAGRGLLRAGFTLDQAEAIVTYVSALAEHHQWLFLKENIEAGVYGSPGMMGAEVIARDDESR